MNIFYASYMDNIERCGFRPNLLVENWNECNVRMLFTSCPEEVAVLQGVDATVHDIGIRINAPHDIPIAQNACISRCFDMGADAVVYVMGDLYITQKGDKAIKERLLSSDEATSVLVKHVHLYSYMWVHYWSLSISTKKERVVYRKDGDGDAVEACYWWMSDELDLLLDIGYMGIDDYYKHVRNHAHIWKKPDPWYDWKMKFMETYHRNKDEATIMAYKQIILAKQRSLEPIDLPVYRDLIEKMGLMDDYHRCTRLMTQV